MIGYLAPELFLPELLVELKKVKSVHGNLVLTEGPIQNSVWAQQVWHNPEIIKFESISQGAKALKDRGMLWASYTFENHRRGHLIQQQLPTVKPRIINFLDALPSSNIGAWAVLDKNTLVAASATNSPFPLGKVQFHEDKISPPSRAYLKLWELFTVYGVMPKAGETVIDFGSCPGGWTWVLQKIGCNVISIDKAPLAARIGDLPKVKFIKTNAFSLKPEDLGKVDWFFSDIICYPDKLLELVLAWQKSGLCENFVCTIKFQGKTDFQTLKKFTNIENAQVRHLYHNKHEVTVWIKKSLPLLV